MSAQGYDENGLQVPAGSCENIEGTSGQTGTGLTHGYTYFVREGDAVKIGSSMRPNERISSLRTGTCRTLETLAIVPMNVADEFGTHQRFSHLRIRGEWFRAEPELLDFIAALKAPPKLPPSPLKIARTGIISLMRQANNPVAHERLSLLSAQLKKGVPARYIARQVEIIGGK